MGKTGLKVLVPATKSAPKAPEIEKPKRGRGRPKGSLNKGSKNELSPTKTPPRCSSSSSKPKSKQAKKSTDSNKQPKYIRTTKSSTYCTSLEILSNPIESDINPSRVAVFSLENG